MALAIEMFFDEDADGAVRAIWRDLAAAGLPSLAVFGHARHRPHVSLAVFDSLGPADQDALRLVLSQAIARATPVLPLTSVGTLPGAEWVLFLGVTMTAGLLDLHARAHARLAGPAGQAMAALPARPLGAALHAGAGLGRRGHGDRGPAAARFPAHRGHRDLRGIHRHRHRSRDPLTG